ncbi:hypothetical protein K492DRAFT_237845 [Lichtheimia hyalospora FSU 10163]|nr:hypothetical protein K492DRAFT_237845 [Lichtheimia hyalospora FSU 10163]
MWMGLMTYADNESMQDTCSVGYPLLSDITRSVSRYFNVLDATNGSAKRAAFILDPRRRIRYSFMLDDDRINHSINTIIALHLIYKKQLLWSDRSTAPPHKN